MSVPPPNDPNPYQPPQSATEWAPPPLERPGRPPLVGALMLGLLGGISYLGFIVVLIRSTEQDRVAGLIFLGNVLLGLAVAIWEMIRHRVVWRSYSVLVIAQFAILGGMLGTGFGDPGAVITINLMIIAIAAGLGGMSFVISMYVRPRE